MFSLTAFKVLFILGFFFVLAAVISIWAVHEKSGEPVKKEGKFSLYLKNTMSLLKKDKNLPRFFIGKNLMFGQYVTKLFYASYAIVSLGVAEKNAGLFISFFLAGFFVAGLTLAKLADRYGPVFMMILSQVLALAGLLLVIFAESVSIFIEPLIMNMGGLLNTIFGVTGFTVPVSAGLHNVFYLVFFFAGLSAICDNVGYSNMAFQSCPIADKTTYVGLVNLFVFILPIIMPFAFGWLVRSGTIMIRTIFVINAFVMIAAILWLYSMVDNPIGFKRLKEKTKNAV